MAVAFVRRTEGTVVGTTLTLNIEASGTDPVLVFGVAYKSNSVLTETSIDFTGAEDFTVELRATDGGDAQCSLWVLAGPSITTANAVLVFPSSVWMCGYVACFSGVDQPNPFTANTAQAQGTDNAPTVDITSDAAEICVDIMAQVSAGPDVATPAHTVMLNLAATGGGTDTRGAGQRVAGTGTRTMSYSMDGSDNWNIIAAALQEPVAVVQHPYNPWAQRGPIVSQ